MGDMGDIFRDMREIKKERRDKRVAAQQPFIDWLQSVSVTWRVLPGGYRFNVPNLVGHHHTFDYWPRGGKWTRTGTNRFAVGEKKLRAAVELILATHP